MQTTTKFQLTYRNDTGPSVIHPELFETEELAELWASQNLPYGTLKFRTGDYEITEVNAAKKLKVEFTHRRTGGVTTIRCTVAQAIERLAYLDKVEAETRRVCPTDSGDVRDSYCREADAIRTAIVKMVDASWSHEVVS